MAKYVYVFFCLIYYVTITIMLTVMWYIYAAAWLAKNKWIYINFLTLGFGLI